MEILKVPATINKVTTMADGSLRLFVDTQEIHPSDKAELMSLHQQLGVFVFSLSNIAKEDLIQLPEVKSPGIGKTPSQRLRSVLYILWEQTQSKQDFETFYTTYMSKLIDQIKERLD